MIDLDEAVDRAIRDLRDEFGEQPICIFIDPTLTDPLAPGGPLDDAFNEAFEKARVSKLKLPYIHDNFDSDRQPYLLLLDSEPAAEKLFSASVRLACQETAGQATQAEARTVCAWFTVRKSARSDATRLSSAARIIKPDGELWYLRFWDPRVVWHLPRVLGPEVFGATRDALRDWRYLSATAEVLPLPALARSHARIVPESSGQRSVSPGRWRVSERQWSGLKRIEFVNRVLASLKGWPLQIDDALAKRIERHFECCTAQGFASADDQVVFSSTALTSHERFDEHPSVAASSHNASSVAEALGDFDDNFWAEVRRGDWLLNSSAKANAS